MDILQIVKVIKFEKDSISKVLEIDNVNNIMSFIWKERMSIDQY